MYARAYGIGTLRLEWRMVLIPLPESIPLALEPQRDRNIDTIGEWVGNAGEAGLR